MSKLVIEFDPREIEIDEEDAGANLLDTIVERAVSARCHELLDKHIKERVQAAINQTIESVCVTKATALIDEAMSLGYQKYNGYGRAEGEPVPMKEHLLNLVRKYMGETTDAYGHRDKTRVEAALMSAVDNFLKTEITAEVTKAKQEVKKAMESGIASMIRAAAQDIIAGKFGS